MLQQLGCMNGSACRTGSELAGDPMPQCVRFCLEYLGDELSCFFERDLILKVLLQNILCALTVCTNGSGLPAAIVPTWITLVQLETICDIPADYTGPASVVYLQGRQEPCPYKQTAVQCLHIVVQTHQPAYRSETPKGRRPPYCVYPCNAKQAQQLMQSILNNGEHSARTAVYLLIVAQGPDKLLNRYRLLVCKGVSLGSQPAGVYEDIGISCRCTRTLSD